MLLRLPFAPTRRSNVFHPFEFCILCDTAVSLVPCCHVCFLKFFSFLVGRSGGSYLMWRSVRNTLYTFSMLSLSIGLCVCACVSLCFDDRHLQGLTIKIQTMPSVWYWMSVLHLMGVSTPAPPYWRCLSTSWPQTNPQAPSYPSLYWQTCSPNYVIQP